MNGDMWSFWGVVVTSFVTIILLLIKNQKATKKVEKYVKPVGNGFTGTVLMLLDKMDKRLDKMQVQIDELKVFMAKHIGGE